MRSPLLPLISLIVLLALLTACEAQRKPTPSPRATTLPADTEYVRQALLEMVQASGNRWMGEDLSTHEITQEADYYRIGRWTFSLEKMTFTFVHTNRNVNPPILFGVSGTLERTPRGKFTAKVTGRAQT